MLSEPQRGSDLYTTQCYINAYPNQVCRQNIACSATIYGIFSTIYSGKTFLWQASIEESQVAN